MKTLIGLVAGTLLTIAVFLVFQSTTSVNIPSLGGVTSGNEYTATTTTSGSGSVASRQIKDSWGTLGSVVVTKAGNAEYDLLNVTSSPYSWSGFPTSTYILAEVPASLAAGTYVYDVIFTNGLFVDVKTGTNGSTTITFR